MFTKEESIGWYLQCTYIKFGVMKFYISW
jgi:hypothetical protein